MVLLGLALTWLAVSPGLTAKSVDGASAFADPLIFLPFISSAPSCRRSDAGTVRLRREPAVHLDHQRHPCRSPGAGRARHLVRLRLVRRPPRRRVRRRHAIYRARSVFVRSFGQAESHADNRPAGGVRRGDHARGAPLPPVGLLPEPERDGSGYRAYDAADVVRLIRIRTLAEAGVPLAGSRSCSTLTHQSSPRRSPRSTRVARRRSASCRSTGAGSRGSRPVASFAVPSEVVTTWTGCTPAERRRPWSTAERDAWILMAARWPEKIPAIMIEKMGSAVQPEGRTAVPADQSDGRGLADEERLTRMADLMAEMFEESAAR